MNDLILRQSTLATDDDWDDLGAGIRSAFPVISYRGKDWWLWHQRQELAIVDEQGVPIKEIGVALLRVPPNLSKRYFSRPFRQGERGRPDCWSDDGKKPHPTASIPEQPDGRLKPTLCSQCFMDTIGSATSSDKTKRMKACSDYKRVAVRLVHPLFGRMIIGNAWADNLVPLQEVAEGVMLLPIPQASLQNLKEYGKFLEGHKAHAIARVTWIGFVAGESFPKLTFRHGPEFDDQTFLQMRELRNSEEVKEILAREAAGDGSEPLEDTQPAEPPQVATPQAPPPQPQQPVPLRPVAVLPPGQAMPMPTPTPIPKPPAPVQQAQPTVTPIRPPFVPSIAKVAAPINTAISTPTAPPPSARPLVQPSAALAPEAAPEGYNEADIPGELDSIFQSLKLEGKSAS